MILSDNQVVADTCNNYLLVLTFKKILQMLQKLQSQNMLLISNASKLDNPNFHFENFKGTQKVRSEESLIYQMNDISDKVIKENNNIMALFIHHNLYNSLSSSTLKVQEILALTIRFHFMIYLLKQLKKIKIL